jgi:hypothetical protein
MHSVALAIAYLTFLIPHGPALRWLYIVLSVISFTTPMPSDGILPQQGPCWYHQHDFGFLVTTLTALYSAHLPSQFLHQNRAKPQVMDRGEAETLHLSLSTWSQTQIGLGCT